MVGAGTCAAILQQFQAHDKSGSGVMARGEIARVFAKIGYGEEGAEQLLVEYGAAGQTVQYREFIEWVMDGEQAAEDPAASPKERVEQVFRSCVQESGGKLPRSLLERVLRAIGGDAILKDVESLVASGMWPEAESPEDLVSLDAWLEWMFAEGPRRASMAYFAGPRGELVTALRRLDPVTEATQPAYGSMDEFRERHAGDEPLLAQLRNRVLICPSCKKPNGFTMSGCNACGCSLEGVEESFNDNIFMGFIYGVAKGRFPYAISTRAETEDLLAFDDPLGITVCHLCVIPTSVFCPDLRFLFTDPARGLKLVDDLMEFGRKAIVEQYWGDAAFRQKYWLGEEIPQTTEEMQELAVLGFNYPPSMFQLHLQFQHGPLFPFHEIQLLKGGTHYTHGRFFPLEYIRAALSRGDAVRMHITDNTRIEDVVAKVSELGIDYDRMHQRMLDKATGLSHRFPIWRKEDFEYTVTEGKVYSNATGEHLPDIDAGELQRKDNVAMKNYAKPKCSLYRYAKSPGEVRHFAEAA